MDLENFDVVEAFKQRFGAYKKIMDEKGEQAAWDTLFQGYPERQKELMGKFIDNCSLAEGFTKAIPVYKQMGMEMEVVDISNKGKDAVIEVQKTCPALTLCKEYGFEYTMIGSRFMTSKPYFIITNPKNGVEVITSYGINDYNVDKLLKEKNNDRN